ncbi:M48 family metalloprotease [candidate division KSB1 bacterium]|nr:M48 family metalloprotease [candidate division KSB1 bacterium]
MSLLILSEAVQFYYHKYSFWVKYLISFLFVVQTMCLILNIKQKNELLWNISSLGFTLLIILGSSNFLNTWRIALAIDFFPRHPLAVNMMTLAQTMGSKFTSYISVRNIKGAFVIQNDLVISEFILSNLTLGEIEAILAHEYSHEIKNKNHNRIFYLWFFLYALYLIFLIINMELNIFSGFAFLYISAPLFWYRELDCDSNAINYTNKADLSSALSRIYEGKLNAFSFYHPSVNYRIKSLG